MAYLSHRPFVPPSRDEIKEWFTPRPTGSLPKLAVCEKPTMNTWPHDLERLDNYFKSAPTAIGFIDFQQKDFNFKNRVVWIGLGIVDPKLRGKGYGREMLEWALEYAFIELSIHRVSLEVYSFNEIAIKLYLTMYGQQKLVNALMMC